MTATHQTEGMLESHEITFTREVPVGESHVFEIVVRFAADAEMAPRVRRASVDRICRASIMVAFDPVRLPRHVWWREWNTLDDDPALVSREVRPDVSGSVHRYVERAEHPVVGFEWEW